MASLSPSPFVQFFDDNGDPLAGGKLYCYAAGTSTPLATYTDFGGGTPNAHPVVLNARGEAAVWLGTLPYYMELYSALNVLVWTADNVNQPNGAGTIAGNTALGVDCLLSNTVGDNNVGVGYFALKENTQGGSNTAVGMNALLHNTTGNSNTAVGQGALQTSNGTVNSAFGVNALLATTGSLNTGLGYNAGSSITSGSKNVIVGAYTGNSGGLDIRTSSNNIVLSDGDGNVRLRTDSTGATALTGSVAVGGIVTAPAQPAFLAYNSATDTDVTGTGVVATVDFDTELFDQGSNFAADTFTAPVTGKYRFSSTVTVLGLIIATDVYHRLVIAGTSAKNYTLGATGGLGVAMAGSQTVSGSVLVLMTAGDTAKIEIIVSGEAGNTADVFGASTLSTWFCGELVC